jgi:hypothetical protein
MSQNDRYMPTMDAFGVSDAALYLLAMSNRSKASSMSPHAQTHQPGSPDSEYFGGSDLCDKSEYFTTSTTPNRYENVTSTSRTSPDEDADTHIFCVAAASTATSNHTDKTYDRSDWAEPLAFRQPQEVWGNWMPPPQSRQPVQSRNEVQVPTHRKQLGHKSGGNQSADLLHFACAMRSKSFDTIENLAHRDPSATYRRLSDTGRIALDKFSLASKKKLPMSVEQGSWIKPRYSFPLNIAIQCNADPRVLELLVNLAPQVLQISDGPFLESPLHIAIKHHCPAASIAIMLLAMPSSAATTDRHSNTPLHAACRLRPYDDDLIQMLLLCHPKAGQEQNFHSHTPLRLLQLSNQKVSEKTLNLMQRTQRCNRSPF